MQSITIGLVAGGILAVAGLWRGKPPYWTIGLVAVFIAMLPWLMDSGDRSTGLEGFVVILNTIVGGVSVFVWGLLTRLIWRSGVS